MSILGVDSSIVTLTDNFSASDEPSEAVVANTDQRFAKLLADEKDAEAIMTEVTKGGAKGYWEWKMKELRKQITEQVMGDMNLTPEKIAQMDAKERIATENKIIKLVEERLTLAMQEEMKRKQRETLAATQTFQSVLQTQNIV